MGFVCSKTNCPVDSLEYMVNVGAVSRPNENIVPAGSTGGKHFRIADGYETMPLGEMRSLASR